MARVACAECIKEIPNELRSANKYAQGITLYQARYNKAHQYKMVGHYLPFYPQFKSGICNSGAHKTKLLEERYVSLYSLLYVGLNQTVVVN